MTPKQIAIIKETWALVAPKAGEVGPLFYNRLFHIAPETKHLFTRTSVPEQSKKLMAMLSYVISKIERLDTLVKDVEAMGRRHLGYGVTDEQYGQVASALLWTLEQGLGNRWNEEVKEAWAVCYTTLAGIMQKAVLLEEAI